MVRCTLLIAAALCAIATPILAADGPTVFITGANRGIGIEFATQYAADGWNVIATCRKLDAAEELNAAGRLNEHTQD